MTRRARLLRAARSMAETAVFLACDLTAIWLVARLAVQIRLRVLPGLYSGFREDVTVPELNVYLIFIAWFFFIFYEGLYTKRFSFWDEVFAIFKACVYATVGVFVIGSLGKISQEISRPVVVLAGLLSVFLLPVVRLTLKMLLRRAGLFSRRVLILGAGETGRIISSALSEESNYGYEIVGFLDDDPEKIGTRIGGIKVHRGVDLAARYADRCGVTDVFVAMPGAGKERMRSIVNTLQHRVERLFVVPDIFGMAVTGTRLMHFFRAQAFAFEMKNNLADPLNNAVKRVSDLLACLLIVPLMLLPMALVSVLIRLGSGGPAILRQERIGRHGRRFRCLKFRTMYEDADRRLEEILASDPEARKQWETYWKLKRDPRITPIGRVLRSTSLDELPQVFNVLMGQMSLVGPRPYLPREWDALNDFSETILGVRPGITGLWQVSGRSETSVDVRLSLDAWYVRNWNLWLDLVILFKTISIVLKRSGAR